jgi:TctA family transporter
MMINIYAAWIGFLLGFLAGAIPGLFFHNSDWLGGYTSWQRRMIRLAHIAFFGIGFINLSFALTARALGLDAGLANISVLLIVGAITMPSVCYLSAWKSAFRNLFFIPATSIIVGVALFVWRIINP